jgi:hypothetical protein
MDLSTKERAEEKKVKPDGLVVVWTSDEREVALKMVFMYTLNSKRFKWGWKNITLVVWGPSSKLLSEDKELQEYIGRMKEAGVTLLACKKCSDLYGVSADLRRLGIEVKYMGKPLTDYLRDDRYRVITV